MEEESQVLEWVEAIVFGGFDDGKDNGAGSGPGGGVGKEEVFAVDDKWFDGALGAVVGDFETAVKQVALKIHPIVHGVADGLAEGVFGDTTVL